MWEQPSSCPRLPRRRKMMQLLAGAGLIAFVVSLALHQDQAGSRPLYIDGGHWATDHGALRLEEAEALRPLAAACIERGMWLEYTTKTQPSKLKNAQTEENWAGSAGLEVDGIDLADGLQARFGSKSVRMACWPSTHCLQMMGSVAGRRLAVGPRCPASGPGPSRPSWLAPAQSFGLRCLANLAGSTSPLRRASLDRFHPSGRFSASADSSTS